ncbi:hypothetical protein GCM10022419_131110 [Nonomuraea rosea]|uniref:Radical SAM core domain-containing protein n=2 Tax=Nonomuraea rosea TaxID=638574 RepID=A0ABP7A1R3_9ACTN
MRCNFCYDELVPSALKRWVPLDDIKLALMKFRNYYLNEYVDFMGGEPSYHPDVLEVVRYSASIGLKPTLVTHGMRLADIEFATALRDAGVHDFLVSVHAVGDTLHKIHRRGRDNSAKQQQGLDNLRSLGVPFRFNTTVVRDTLAELPVVAELAVQTGARAVNFLTFNPHFEWGGEAPPFQVQHSEAAVALKEAIDILTAGEVEANVRYMPLCTMRGYEQHIFTQFQLPYDTHEWDYNSWYDTGFAGRPDQDWYLEASERQRIRHGYVHAKPCEGCSLRAICDGVSEQYLDRFGDGELQPYNGPDIFNPTHFIAEQPVIASEPSTPPPPIDEALASPLPLTQFAEKIENRAGVSVEFSPKRR